MAGIDIGSGSKRSVNRELPLVPFIDFLLCLVAFLLVTAVWSQMARLEANANVPGQPEGTRERALPELHVDLRESGHVVLEWRDGATVLDHDVVQRGSRESDEIARLPALERALAQSWFDHGGHRAATDLRRDRAVVHASNAAPFEEIAAAMDAVASVKRPFELGTKSMRASAFETVFAVD